jgi:hypothetical protein
LNEQLENYKLDESEINVHNSLKNFLDSRLIGEWDINNLGYEYMLKLNQPKIGLCILKFNTIHFPESPNAFNSYGEALKINGNLTAALENYQKALDIAIRNKDGNLTFYKDEVQKIINEIKAKK